MGKAREPSARWRATACCSARQIRFAPPPSNSSKCGPGARESKSSSRNPAPIPRPWCLTRLPRRARAARRRDRGYRRPPAHKIEPDGRAGKNEAHGGKSRSRRAARNSTRDGRNDRTERVVQAREFTSAVGVTGIVLTKLDGTAKGGIVVAITRELGLPVRLCRHRRKNGRSGAV